MAEIQKEMLGHAKKRLVKRGIKNVDYYLCDGKTFPFNDGKFDRIFDELYWFDNQ